MIGLFKKKEFILKDALLASGFMESEEDEYTLMKPNGVSIRFYTTDKGLQMISVVDMQKPKSRWMHFRFRCDFIKSMEDFMFLMQGATVRGF